MISRLWLAVAAALVVAGCTTSSTSTTTTSVVPVSTTTFSSSTSSSPSQTTPTTLPSGTEELPEPLREAIARLILATEELRELSFVEPPEISVITAEELTARVIEQVEEDYEDIDADEAMYKLLGLVSADFDLLGTIKALYGEQVAGYYDGDIKELVVTARDETFSVMEEVTLVHELTHALTDQHQSFNEHFNNLFDTDRFDEASAFQALIEGDATLTELLYAQQLSPAEQQEFLEETFSVDTTVFDLAPQFMQDSLLFPYDAGLGFVQSLYEAGGFATIDQAYGDPPISTEQIIEPGDYGRDEPKPVPLEQNELAGYEIAYGSTWGELGFRLMFDQMLGGADQASDGWGGDSYDLFFDGSDVVLVLVYQGDTAQDSDQLLSALSDYIEVGMDLTEGTTDGNGQAFTGDNYAFLSSSGEQVVFIAAGDPTAGATARSWFPGF